MDAGLVRRFQGCPVHVKSGGAMAECELTLRRYSTARSGLKNAALMARSMSTLGKPMLSMFATAAAPASPIASADGSLKLRGGSAVVAGAGDGVAGALLDVFDAGAGAAGATGVEAGAGAGVEGALVEDVAADEAAGAALGYEPLAHSFSMIGSRHLP